MKSFISSLKVILAFSILLSLTLGSPGISQKVKKSIIVNPVPATAEWRFLYALTNGG